VKNVISNVCVVKVVESNVVIVAFVDMGQWDDRVQPELSFLCHQCMLGGYMRRER